jgi:hypothetical protein
MFAGMFSSTIATIEYAHASEVHDALQDQLAEICPRAIESAERRRSHLAEIRQQRLGERFLMQRIRHGIELDAVAAASDIQAPWIREIERCPDFGSTLSVMMIRRISSALNCCTSQGSDGQFHIKDLSGKLSPDVSDSLTSLAQFANARQTFDERRIFRLWQRYVNDDAQRALEATAYRGEEKQRPLAVDDWRRRYDELGFFD